MDQLVHPSNSTATCHSRRRRHQRAGRTSQVRRMGSQTMRSSRFTEKFQSGTASETFHRAGRRVPCASSCQGRPAHARRGMQTASSLLRHHPWMTCPQHLPFTRTGAPGGGLEVRHRRAGGPRVDFRSWRVGESRKRSSTVGRDAPRVSSDSREHKATPRCAISIARAEHK